MSKFSAVPGKNLPSEIRPISPRLSVSGQIGPHNIPALAAAGFRTIICNRPNGEEAGQPAASSVEAAARVHGLAFAHVPVRPGHIVENDILLMAAALHQYAGPTLAYCGSGSRSETLAQMVEARSPSGAAASYDVVIVGGGSAGIATAASILKRNRHLSLAIIDPAEEHYYQPGFTMVGAGIFKPEATRRFEASVIPAGATWVKSAVSVFKPDNNLVRLSDGRSIGYSVLVVCPGVTLDWGAIKGLEAALGRGGVTSNYRHDLAPYTSQLVHEFKGGRAIFTQPPMPIKCAGAPQKAMYLSCSHWEQSGVLTSTDVSFHNAGPTLFGVADYVPALQEYVHRYGIGVEFGSKLVAVDGAAGIALFERQIGDHVETVEQPYDFLHAVPPQVAPAFIRASPLSAASGFVAVDEATLQHPAYKNIFALGDVCATSNAKTAAAARKQAPVVAVNAIAQLRGDPPTAVYDGYGSCPLTVEKGKIVLAEFGYGGRLLPTFPKWIIDGTRPSRLSWALKETILPHLYWNGMLKGREWLARPASGAGN